MSRHPNRSNHRCSNLGAFSEMLDRPDDIAEGEADRLTAVRPPIAGDERD